MNDVITDSEILELLDSEFEEDCNYPDCSGVRTHLLCCPICPATENMCEPHTQKALRAKPAARVMFNNTCKHTVLMVDCEKIPTTYVRAPRK